MLLKARREGHVRAFPPSKPSTAYLADRPDTQPVRVTTADKHLDKIRHCVEVLGLSQRAAAKKIGIPRDTLGWICRRYDIRRDV